MKQKLALSKINFILIAIGAVIIIAGLLLMTGPSSTETHFEPDIFSTRRILCGIHFYDCCYHVPQERE